jgi:TM2 domain-containing membrane protein YozV
MKKTPSVQVTVHQKRPAHPVHFEEKSAGTAGILSFFFPGAGQMYLGEVARGIKLMLATYLTLPIGIGGLLYFYQIYDAIRMADEMNKALENRSPMTGVNVIQTGRGTMNVRVEQGAAPVSTEVERTQGQRYAWLPAVGVGGAAFSVATWGLWGLLAAVPLVGVSAVGAVYLWQNHATEKLKLKSLQLFRNLPNNTVTRDEMVRVHGFDPAEADRVLNWLVAQELLTADWDNFDAPLVYRRHTPP